MFGNRREREVERERSREVERERSRERGRERESVCVFVFVCLFLSVCHLRLLTLCIRCSPGLEATPRKPSQEADDSWTRHAVILADTPDVVGGACER